MDNTTQKFPYYAKLSFTLVSLIAIVVILYYGQSIITPLLIAMLFGILLSPLADFFNRKLHLPNVVAVVVTLVIFLAFFAGLIYFLSWQIGEMISDWAKIRHNANIHITHLQEIVRKNFNLSMYEQKKMLDNAASESGREIVGSTLISVTDTLLNFTLIPIYTFLIILYKSHFKKFLCKLFDEHHHAKLQEIMLQIKVSIQSYITGLFLEMLTVATLTSIGYMIAGIEYALLLGVITGIMNLIPYVGILFACLLSMAATLTTTPDVSLIVGVIIVNAIVQFIDNNFLVPMIVSSKVEINALVSIVGIIVGGTVAGVAGMFLAIPLIAIIKVIFDRIDQLEPWGYLMGDNIPKTYKWRSMRFPYYNAATTSEEVIVKPEAPTVLFTETTTKTKDNDTLPEKKE
ncbi:MAG: AI-2E family transporter [Flavobacterium sp.]|nr:MAG: AI-2E family transporter [Flavobacterium sp.]